MLPLIGGLLLATAGEGPDFGHYADWARAALHGDIFDLRGNVLSPLGVPFTIASSGTGLLLAAGKAVLVPLPFSVAAMATGWLAAVTFWASTLVVLRRLSRGDEWLALYGAGVLFVGTHAGLYSHAYSTEIFADALIALLWALSLTRERWRLVDCATAGALAGLLFLVRPHVVLYAVPALWMAVVAGRHTSRSARGSGPEGPPRRRLIAIAIPLGVAVAQYGFVNRWMTGEPWHPPYVYGAVGFSSVDMVRPEIAAVLLHPWHGLLPYHPLYGVAFVAVLFTAWRTRRDQVWWWMTALAAVVHVWVQGAWYIWWLGGSTFGMRGMAPAALPLVAGLVATVRRDADTNPAHAARWLWMGLIACAWSYPLMLQGNTQFLTWRALLDAQTAAIATVALALGAWICWIRRVRRATTADVFSLARWSAVIVIAAVVAYLSWQFPIGPPLATRAAEAVLGMAALYFVAQVAPTWAASTDGQRRLTPVVAWSAVALFAIQAGLFLRLALRTEQYLASGAPPPRSFDYVGASPVDELRVTYAEYLDVPGFAERKAAFHRFLDWQREHMVRRSPP